MEEKRKKGKGKGKYEEAPQWRKELKDVEKVVDAALKDIEGLKKLSFEDFRISATDCLKDLRGGVHQIENECNTTFIQILQVIKKKFEQIDTMRVMLGLAFGRAFPEADAKYIWSILDLPDLDKMAAEKVNPALVGKEGQA
jgi:hypothetical protein